MQHIHTDNFNPDTAAGTVSLQSLQHELAGVYAGLAVLVNDCYRQGAGNRMLGGSAESHPGVLIDAVDVTSTTIGKMLPIWHRYGYQGIVSVGFEPDDIQDADGPFEQLFALLNVLRFDNHQFDWCLMGAGLHRSMAEKSHLAELVKHVSARSGLDCGAEEFGVEELALLAGMTERSVRNATTADGDGRLALLPNGHVSHEEAKRWLHGRRGFVPTQVRELPKEFEMPDSLDDVEIPVFVRRRLIALAKQKTSMNAGHASGDDEWLMRASRESGLSVDRLQEVTELPLSIRPQECAGLAKALKVDTVWFNYQVMAALFPQQVDMLLNPASWKTTQPARPDEPPAQAVTVTLTRAMLANGYLDIPASAKSMFPDECFTERTADPTLKQAAQEHQARKVELVFGSHREKTDIRVKSAKTISPRRRFTGWFNTELGAKAGDRIRIEKTGERVYTLSHITG